MGNFGSILSEWFLGTDERRAAPLSAPRRFALLALLVLLGYGVAWLLVRIAQDLTAEVLAALAPIAAALLGEPMRFHTEGPFVFFVTQFGRRLEAWVDSRDMTTDLPLLLTLMLVTPGLRWQRRLLYTLGAVGLALLVYTGFLITKVQVVLITANQATTGSPSFWKGMDDIFEITGKTFSPIFIWLVFALPYLLGRVDQRAASAPDRPSRNAPCPCGSGRKYKKSCGA